MAAQKGNRFGKNADGTPCVYWTEERIKEASSLICDEIVKGRSVRSILNPATRDKAKFPSYVEYLGWLSADADLSKQYARAMEWRAEGLLEDTIEIADDATMDTIESVDGDGCPVIKANIEHIQRTKIRIEARQFALRKMAPKKYGDKVDITTDGDKINQAGVINIALDGKAVDLGLKK